MKRWMVGVGVVLLFAGAACSSDDDSPDDTSATTAAVEDAGAQITTVCDDVDAFVTAVAAAGDRPSTAERDALVETYQDLQAANRDLGGAELSPDAAEQLEDCSSEAAQAFAALPRP